MYILEKEKGINPKILKEFISKHLEKIKRYDELEKLYLGKHKILTQKSKEEYKPDNRIVINYAKYIVDTFNGFFIGIPVKVRSDNKEVDTFLQEFRKKNFLDDVEAEISKMTSIYGLAYQLIFQNENSESEVAILSPKKCFLVRDDSIRHNIVAGVYFNIEKNGSITGELYTLDKVKSFKQENGNLEFTDEQEHYYKEVPIIEYVENAEKMSLIESVETIINAIDKVISEKANDVDYFSDAYLKILGERLDQDTIKNLRDNRIINFEGQGTDKMVVEFLQKPDADKTQENLLERLIDSVYQISQVANINDDKFGNISGVALEYKMLPMRNLAMIKERKFKASMQKLYKIILGVPNSVTMSMADEWKNLRYLFTRNIPENLREEAETAGILSSLVSQETALSTLSIVDDVKDEMERIKKDSQNELNDYDNNIQLSRFDKGKLNE
ncbi:phage portal protein [Helcococcus bovis]|uniref:phage portal protein n=1 Tax=Helcococcus bovis TaxID=3153252 RepID=UPI0038B85C46